LAGNSVRTEIARAKDTGRFGEFRDFDYGFGDGHDLILQNAGDYVQVPTLGGGSVL